MSWPFFLCSPQMWEYILSPHEFFLIGFKWGKSEQPSPSTLNRFDGGRCRPSYASGCTGTSPYQLQPHSELPRSVCSLQWRHVCSRGWAACPRRVCFLCQEKFRYYWYWPQTISFSFFLSTVRPENTPSLQAFQHAFWNLIIKELPVQLVFGPKTPFPFWH